jgi:acyl carrier protein phosphodiesterase
VVYEKTFKLDKSGIVGVTIPATGNNKSLEVGKRYVWSFSLVCDPEDRSGDLVVKGFVQRIEPQATLKSDLANADQMTKLNVYATNGIWYETLATLAQMRRQTPGDARLTAKWTQLLESQGLESVAAQPLVQPL